MTSKVIQDLWILSESGIVLFSRVYNPKISEQLFGALMTALNSFAGELSSGGLTSFELKSIRFTLIKTKNLIFVANSSKNIKEKHVIDELKRISDKFFELYGDILQTWDSDVSKFSGFEEQIVDSLEETIKKLQKAFW
ncbi:MAG: hypothetical protein ACFFAH_06065 [Promethearchaeota archaeon]